MKSQNPFKSLHPSPQTALIDPKPALLDLQMENATPFHLAVSVPNKRILSEYSRKVKNAKNQDYNQANAEVSPHSAAGGERPAGHQTAQGHSA
jgi:hypothetical protein